MKELKAAEASYKGSLDVRPDFAYAMMNLGRIYMVQDKFSLAIEWLKKATAAEPDVPRGFQLLGEAYLLDRKGTLGVETLYEAIRLIHPSGFELLSLVRIRSHLRIPRPHDE